MKIVIDIDENVYTRLFDSGIQDNEIAVDDVCEMARTIRGGTPLPKNVSRQAYDNGFDDGLEQGLKIGEPCWDCISRQAALDCCTNGWNKDFKEIMKDIRSLPSVTPAEKMEVEDDRN